MTTATERWTIPESGLLLCKAGGDVVSAIIGNGTVREGCNANERQECCVFMGGCGLGVLGLRAQHICCM